MYRAHFGSGSYLYMYTDNGYLPDLALGGGVMRGFYRQGKVRGNGGGNGVVGLCGTEYL